MLPIKEVGKSLKDDLEGVRRGSSAVNLKIDETIHVKEEPMPF